MTTIPRWIPPVTPADRLQDRRTTQTVVAEGSPIPVAYGRVEAPGRIFALDYDAGTWTLGALFCVGEIDGFEQIFLNGEPAPEGMVKALYRGTTTQGVDPTLDAAISDYDDDLVVEHPAGDIGIAYGVIEYTDDDFPAFPQITARLRGRRIFDPRTHQVAYARTPALAIRDLIRSPHFGLGDVVDNATVVEVANSNDELVGGSPRREFGLLLEQRRETEEWIEVLQTYAGCWAFKRGNVWRLVPDRPRTPKTLTPADGQFAPPVLADAQNAPTVVRVVYTDTSTTPWRDREAFAALDGVGAGTMPRRESLIRLGGIQSFAQAKREAVERLKKLQTSLLTMSGIAFDQHIGLERGEVVDLDTHPLYPGHTTFRLVEAPALARAGRIEIRGSAYSESDYDDSSDVVTWGSALTVAGDLSALPTPGATRGTPDGTFVAGEPALTVEEATQRAIAAIEATTGVLKKEATESGSFTLTFNIGFTTNPSTTVFFQRTGRLVAFIFDSQAGGTSNDDRMIGSGIPESLRPPNTRTGVCQTLFEGTRVFVGRFIVTNIGELWFQPLRPQETNAIVDWRAWATSGAKGVSANATLIYMI